MICPCGETVSEFIVRGRCLNCRVARAQVSAARLGALNNYECSCECCAEDDPRFLLLQHYLTGKRCRAKTLRQLAELYDRLPQYQVLCASCRYSRQRSPQGLCWHDRMRALADRRTMASPPLLFVFPCSRAEADQLAAWNLAQAELAQAESAHAQLTAQEGRRLRRRGALPELPE